MREANLFLIFLECLNKTNIKYMTTGSVASIIYGEPRVTYDIDLVLQLYLADIPQLIGVFKQDEFYCPPIEVIEKETVRKSGGHFNLIHHETGFKADIYPTGEDTLHIWAMNRRKNISIDNCDLWLAPPEYVIVRKLEFYKLSGSSKHLSDIRRMLEISRDIINFTDLKKIIIEHDLMEQWTKVGENDW
jgi:hypothetical protein